MQEFKRTPQQIARRLANVLPIFLILISMACTMPTFRTPTPGPNPIAPTQTAPPPKPTPIQRALPPALVESTPTPGTEIPLNSLITLFFNQPMDRASVESALKARSFLIQNVVWSDDATMTINPGQAFPPGATLGIQLDTQAKAANGLELRQPISLTYQTVGYLDLAQRLPEAQATNVNPSSAVVAAFDHPVVPLGADPASLPNPLKIDPPASGRGEWINTSTYIFYPDPALAGGQSYTVTVDQTLHGIDGNPLNKQEPGTFTTAMPQVETVTTEGGDQPSGLDGPLTFTFNQPMNRDSVQANFQVIDPNGTAVPGEFTWDKTGTGFTWKPANPLQRAAIYRYSLDGQAQGTGGTPIGRGYQASFQTVPELSVTATNPAEGGVLDLYNQATLSFSGPIDPANPGKYITVEPKLPGFYAYYAPDERSLSISGFYDPSQDYTITVSPDLTDPWGGKLSNGPFVLHFRSAPPQPAVMVGNGSGIHFVTSQDTALSAQVSGMQSLPMSIGALPLEDFLRMQGSNGYEFQRDYTPANAQSWNQMFQTNPNRTEQSKINLSPDGNALLPGIYLMRLSMPNQTGGVQNQFVIVSDRHMLVKVGPQDALAWLVDMNTGQPVANAPVSIYDSVGRGGQLLASGQTDAQGIFTATFPARKDPYIPLVAISGTPGEAGFAAGLSTWSSKISPWDFNLTADYNGPRKEVYLYTDRPIYRPGQTVNFRGVLRQAFDGRYTIPSQQSLTVTLNDDMGQTIDTKEFSPSSYGTIHGEFDLPAGLRPGSYSLNIPEADTGFSLGSILVPVADYRKPEINLAVTFPKEDVLVPPNGSTAKGDVQATVNARYFFDAPAGNVPFSWTLNAYPTNYDLQNYQTGLQGVESWSSAPRYGMGASQQIASGDGITSPDGTATIDLKEAISQATFQAQLSQSQPYYPQRQNLVLEVTAKDESGLPVSARASTNANPADYTIGVKPDTWSGQAEQPFGFEVQVAGWDGTSAGQKQLRAEFSRVDWAPDENGVIDPFTGTIPQKPVFTVLASTDFTTSTDGQARIEFTPSEPGIYQLNVFPAAQSSAPRTEITAWVGGAGQFALPQTDDRRIKLQLDKKSYKPGETARLFIPNPFSTSAQALLTIERGSIKQHQTLNLAPGGSTIDLPLTGNDAPNVYVSVTLLANQQSQSGNQKSSLDFRQGYIELPVEPSEQTLNVQISRTPEKTGPGGKVTFEILVTDQNGQPVQGEFSLAVVDLAALALADPNSVAILPHYYGEQPLGVQTGLPLSAYAARDYAGNRAGGMGGGGGGEGAPLVRENFPDTAYWQADLVTGADGKAQVELTLPDNLTTWQVETRGLTADTRVGQAETQVVTSQDLLIRPVTPRFLVAGDHVELAAVVQNNSDQAFSGVANLQGQGVTLDDPAAANIPVSLAPGERARVSWWATAAGDAEAADLVFSLTAQDGSPRDAARPPLGKLPILHYSAPQTFRTVGTLDEPGERLELISLPRFVDPATGPQGGGLRVDLAPSLAATMLQAATKINQDQCLCSELSVSQLLANLSLASTLQQAGADSQPAIQTSTEQANKALQELINHQNPDGGWSWWPSAAFPYGTPNPSDPFLTSYVLFSLTQAKSAGLAVGDNVIQRAVDYLNQNLPYDQITTPGSANPTPTLLDQMAFAQFALTAAGSGNQATVQELFTRRASLSPWAQALLALASARLNGTGSSDQTAQTLVSDLESSAIRSAAGAHWELPDTISQGGQSFSSTGMTGTLANSAIVTYALTNQDPKSPLVADAARFLVDNRQPDGAWSGSYASAWTLLALDGITHATGELSGNYSFGANLNDAPIVTSSPSSGSPAALSPMYANLPLSQLYTTSPNLLSIQRGVGDGRLYYSAILDVSRPSADAPPLSQGMSLSRQYFPSALDCSKEACTPIESAQTNEKVTVRLTLNVPHDAYYIQVQDFIPAGAEILDTRLKTSEQSPDAQGQSGGPSVTVQYDPANPFAEGWGSWLFHPAALYDDHIAWAADYLPKGTYELTYSFVPLQRGEYQVLPAHAWETYFPEVQGTSAGGKFTIK